MNHTILKSLVTLSLFSLCSNASAEPLNSNESAICNIELVSSLDLDSIPVEFDDSSDVNTQMDEDDRAAIFQLIIDKQALCDSNLNSTY